MNPFYVVQGLKLLKDLSSTGDDKEDEKIVKEILSVEKPFWHSKRFWMTVAGVLIPIINKVSGLELSETEIVPIIGMIAAYVLGKSHEQKG
jgi:hypothetical protein